MSQLLSVSNPFHIAFLSNTIDFDSKITRMSIKSRELVIHLLSMDSSSNSYGKSVIYSDLTGPTSSFKEVMRSLYHHFPYEFGGGHQDKIKVTKADDMILIKARQTEFFELYSPYLYDPALNDIQLDLLPRVIDSLGLTSSDIFIDLGSSTGRLVVAARLLSDCKNCIGIELSPSR